MRTRQQAVRVQNPLDLLDGARSVRHVRGRVNPLAVCITERLAQIRHRFDQPAHLRDQRLRLNRREKPLAQRMAKHEESEHRAEEAPAAQRMSTESGPQQSWVGHSMISMISFLVFLTMKGAGFKLTLDWYTTYGIPF